MRFLIAKALPSYTASELPMSKRNGDVSMAAAVYFPYLVSVVMHFLDILHESERLTWHSGTIPSSEVWIKIGGDHGGGSFKLSMQIANTKRPNATDNTIPLFIFNEKDSPANLQTALTQYSSQIEQLQQATWHAKAIVVYMFGDYEFQTVNYGLSGSVGVRPCLHCHTTKSATAQPSEARPQGDREPRTLASLATDYNGFEAAGGQLPRAKFYNNVVRRPILPIPIRHVIIPILHLDLGIFTWLYVALMKDLQELDAQLAAKCEPLTAVDATAFQKLCELRSEEVAANTVQAQREGIVQQLQFVALYLQQHPEQHVMEVINDLQQAYRAADQQFQQRNVHIARLQQDVMKASGSKDLKGPCSSAIEPVLQQYKIERQVYHGGAFIGNHVGEPTSPTRKLLFGQQSNSNSNTNLGEHCSGFRRSLKMVMFHLKGSFSCGQQKRSAIQEKRLIQPALRMLARCPRKHSIR